MQPVSTETQWQQAAVIFGLITFGLAQSFYGLVLAKPQAFPQNIFFASWILLYLQIIPFFLLFSADSFLKRHARSFQTWRALLGTLLVLSMLRQFQVFYAAVFHTYLNFIPAIFLYWIVIAIAFLIFLKWSRAAAQYFFYLGICSIALPVYYLVQSHSLHRVDFVHPNSASSLHLTPVVMVVFDELSLDTLTDQGKMDRASFPNFASFQLDSIWYRNATTNHWSTVDSLPSMITGSVYAGEASTLFELLPEYSSVVVSSEVEFENWLLSKPGRGGVKRLQGKSYYLSRNPARALEYLSGRLFGYFRFTAAENIVLDDPAYHVSLSNQIDQCSEWIRTGKSMILLWHPSIPHSPFLFDQDGAKEAQKLNYFPFENEYDRSKFDSIYKLYRKQVQFADSVLGNFLSGMKQAGLYDRSIIIVTSDHGLRVWGDLPSHGELIARIPFLIKIPGKPAGITDTDFQLIDLVPTLIDVLALSSKSHSFEGISGGSEKEREKVTHFHPGTAVYDSINQKWIDSNASKQGLSMATDPKKRLARDTFSSIYVWDDLFTADQEKRDFLELYLKRDFPIHLQPRELEEIRSTIANEPKPENPQKHFRLGMYYFYISIWDTYQIAHEGSADIDKINKNWQNTLHHLQMAGQLSPLLQQNIHRFLNEADSNRDGHWNQEELKRLIHSRTEVQR